MAITDTETTRVSDTIPQMYSHMTADYREANFVYVNLFDRKYESDLSEGDRVFIHGVNAFQDTQDTTTLAANPSTAGGIGAAGTGGSPTGVLSFDEASLKARIVLVADTHIYQAFELEYEADLFSNIGLMEKLTKASGYAVAHRIDDDAAGLIDDFSSSTAVGTFAVGLTESDVKRGVQYLNDAFAPEDGRVFVFSPAEQMNLFGIERFVNAQYSASIGNVNVDSKYKGYVTNILGMDWYMSLNVEGTNAAGHDNGIWQKEACATLVVEESRPVSHYEITTDTTRYAVHAIYGFVEVREDHGVLMKGM